MVGVYFIFPDVFLVELKTDELLMFTKGRIECVYEPAMTKAFLHGRTEAIRSVQPESVGFVKVGVIGF